MSKIENPNALKPALAAANELVGKGIDSKHITFGEYDIGPFATVRDRKESETSLVNATHNLILRERESAQKSALNSLRGMMCGDACGSKFEDCFASQDLLGVANGMARSLENNQRYYKQQFEVANQDKTGLQSLVCFLITAVWALICVLIGRHFPATALGIGIIGGLIMLFIGISIGTGRSGHE